MKNVSALVLLLVFAVSTAQAQDCPMTGLSTNTHSMDYVAKSGSDLSSEPPAICIAGKSVLDSHQINADNPIYSSVEEIWSGFTWFNNTMTENEYDENGRITRRVHSRWVSGPDEFVAQTATQYLFDEATNTSENISGAWNGSVFINQERNLFQKDEFGNQIKIERFDWENGAWKTRFLSESVVENGLIAETTIQTTHALGTLINSKHKTFEYDAEGRQTVEIQSVWSADTQSWDPNTRDLTSYNGSTVVIISQAYSGGGWVSTDETIEIYDNDLLVQHTSRSLTGASASNRFLYSYDAGGNLTETVAQEPDGAGGWRSYFRNAFTLDIDGDPLVLLIQLYDQSKMAWENVSRVSYNYQVESEATSVEEMIPGLTSFDVYPYPATDRVNVALQLSEATGIQVEVYDILGRRVKSLVDGTAPAGTQRLEWIPQNEPPGLYFVRLTLDGAIETKTIMLLK